MLLVNATLICEILDVNTVEDKGCLIAYFVSVPVRAFAGGCDSHTEASNTTEHVVST